MFWALNGVVVLGTRIRGGGLDRGKLDDKRVAVLSSRHVSSNDLMWCPTLPVSMAASILLLVWPSTVSLLAWEELMVTDTLIYFHKRARASCPTARSTRAKDARDCGERYRPNMGRRVERDTDGL